MTLNFLRIAAAFIFFGFAPIIAIAALGSVWSQSQAVAIISVVSTPQTAVIPRLARTNDFSEYKRLATRAIEDQNEISRGVSEIATASHSSLRKTHVHLWIIIIALYFVALGASVMLLRKSSK